VSLVQDRLAGVSEFNAGPPAVVGRGGVLGDSDSGVAGQCAGERGVRGDDFVGQQVDSFDDPPFFGQARVGGVLASVDAVSVDEKGQRSGSVAPRKVRVGVAPLDASVGDRGEGLELA